MGGESACYVHMLDDDGRMPEPPPIRLKRVYGDASARSGEIRVLVDRVWPRGVRKDRLELDRWEREVAPSDALRKWFAHDPRRWHEFERRYRSELADKRQQIRDLAQLARGGRLVLLYGAHDPKHNQAVVLKEVLDDEWRAEQAVRR